MMKRWLVRLAKLLLVIAFAIAGLMTRNVCHTEVAEPTMFEVVKPPKAFEPVRLRVVTWNVWGLWLITPRRAERMQVIAREIAKMKPDIVGFQEAFVAADRELLTTALRPLGLAHSRYFSSGLVGSGLLLVSRYPLETTGFIRYADNGRPEALQHGDWWAGKGLSLVTMRLPGDVRLYVGNTHMHAGYRENPYHETKLAQARQLIPWVNRVKETDAPSLWLGDWNNKPDNDVLAPLAEAGGWNLLNADMKAIDHIFGSGRQWEWSVIDGGKVNGLLDGDAKVPWSDHAARWIEVELRR